MLGFKYERKSSEDDSKLVFRTFHDLYKKSLENNWSLPRIPSKKTVSGAPLSTGGYRETNDAAIRIISLLCFRMSQFLSQVV